MSILSRRLAARVVIGLIVTGVLLADLGVGGWLAPSATAQSAAPYHWARKRSHFRLRFGDNVDGDWNRYLRATLADWNQNDTITLIEAEGATDPQSCQPVAGRVEVCDWWYGTQTGWLGMTRLYFNARGDHIDAATVQLNNSFLYAPNSRYNSDAARRHTLCHELGHTLGLDHVDTTSCMNNSRHAVFNYVTPLGEDFRRLRRIYEHPDATRTVARQSSGDLSAFAPATQLEPESEEDVMVLPLDEETLVLTFILWADEEGLAATDVTTALEGEIGLEPTIADSDGDRVADADELTLYHTDPTLADTDGDGVFDGEELFGRQTNPLLWDVSTALPGSPDGTAQLPQAADGTLSGDTGVWAPVSEPAPDADLDADNYPDALEEALGLDAGNPDTDGDAVADGDELTLYGTDPIIGDTDGDGVADGTELFATGTDPLIADATGAGP